MYMTIPEVKANNSTAKNVSDCSLSALKSVEIYVFQNELKSVKEQLDSHAIVYSDIEEYDKEHVYNIGDVCSYKGVIYKATKNSENKSPHNIKYWENAPRFNKDCLEDLWCDYIAPYIAAMVVYRDPPMITELATLNGVLPSAALIRSLTDKQASVVDLTYMNLHSYLENNDCLGIKIPSCKDECGNEIITQQQEDYYGDGFQTF